MPFITVKGLDVITLEMKREVVKDITESVVKNFGVPPEVVFVDFIELSKENLASSGKLFIDGMPSIVSGR